MEAFANDERLHDLLGAHTYVKSELSKIELSIPEIDANKKTKVYTPSQPAQFLGVELHLNGQDYVLDVPMKQIVKACDNLPSLEMAHPSK